MSEEQTTQPVVDETKAPAQPGAEATSARNDDDSIDVLLHEFDRAQPNGEGGQAPAAPEMPQPPPPVDWSKTRAFSDSDMLGLAMETDRQRIMLDALQLHHQQQLHQQQERADFAEVLSEGASWLEDLPSVGDPQAAAQRWILSEAQLDPRLADAWEHRRDSKEHQQYAVRLINKAFSKMRSELAHRPDPELTADKWAVAAFMRGGSKTPPPSTPPDYSKMTDAQFEAEKAKVGM